MKISYSEYELKPLSLLNNQTENLLPRQGALLKMQWPDGKIGYADLHPWPELGDQSLELQIQNMKKGKMSSQVEQSIWLARRDAVARSQNVSLLNHVDDIRNNYLVTDVLLIDEAKLKEISRTGYKSLKIKVGRDQKAEADLINRASPYFLLRLDFNSVGNLTSFQKFMQLLKPETIKKIEYAEDPFPYDQVKWAEAQKIVPLAADREITKIDFKKTTSPSFQVLVIKPALVDVEKAIRFAKQENLKCVITNQMDHAVGQMHALAVAAELKREHEGMMLDSGCATHHLFEKDDYFKEIYQQGAYVQAIRGAGIGFTELLEGRQWQHVFPPL